MKYTVRAYTIDPDVLDEALVFSWILGEGAVNKLRKAISEERSMWAFKQDGSETIVNLNAFAFFEIWEGKDWEGSK
jgi:hypothetical protein